MRFINQEIRNRIKCNLNKYNNIYQFIDSPNFTLGRLDEIFRINRRKRKESEKSCRSSLNAPLSIANILSASIFTLTCSVYNEQDGDGILPKQWIADSGKPNPNIVFGALLTQITQLSISIIELIEKGLDNAARIVLRSAIELTWQTLILLYDRKDLLRYVKAETLEEANQTWWKLFGKGRVQKKLVQIEKHLNIETSARITLKKRRKDVFQFYSESVHHGYVNTIVSSIVWEFEKDIGTWCSLGGASQRSHDTIISFCQTAIYFINMFEDILNEFHEIYFDQLPMAYWKDTLILRDCAIDLINEG